MKIRLCLILMISALATSTRASCDLRPGVSIGVRVLEFVTGNVTHSKMSLRESSIQALTEELVSLRDMGVCEDVVVARKCQLKLEKRAEQELIVLYRERERWVGWKKKDKKSAQSYVKSLKHLGFCS